VTHRRLLLAFGLAGLIIVGFWVVMWFFAPKHRIWQVAEHPQAIKVGILQSRVEAILGVPPGDYTTTPKGRTRLWPAEPKGEPQWKSSADWFADGATVRVYFDDQSRVLFATSSLAPEALHKNVWQRVCRWLGL
jgi:hypothetical protein